MPSQVLEIMCGDHLSVQSFFEESRDERQDDLVA